MLKRGKHVCRHIRAKTVRLDLEPYSRYLISRGYSARTRQVYVRAVEYFGRWLGRRRISWSQVEQFLDRGLPTCQCLGIIRDRPHNRAALHRLLEMLGQDRKEAAFPQGWQGNLLRCYQEHLIKVRGLAPATISQHLMYTRLMLNRLMIRRASQFMGWTPELIEQYVSREGRSCHRKAEMLVGVRDRSCDSFCKTVSSGEI